METDRTEEITPSPADVRGRRIRSGIVALGAAAGLTLAGLGVAAAQTGSQQPAQPDNGAQTAPARGPDRGMMKAAEGPRGFHGPMKGLGIHGEFTTRAPDGGYQTLASQLGEVTDVSAKSITVKSEDGFSRTYTVDDNTLVNAGNDGIGDVKKGDQVQVLASIKDGKAGAVEVHDATQVHQLREKWAPRRQAPGNQPQNQPNQQNKPNA